MVDYCIIYFQLYPIPIVIDLIANLTKELLSKHFDTVQFMNGNQIVNVYDAAGRSLPTSLMNATAHATLPCSAPSTRYATSQDATPSCSLPNCLTCPDLSGTCPNPPVHPKSKPRKSINLNTKARATPPNCRKCLQSAYNPHCGFAGGVD